MKKIIKYISKQFGNPTGLGGKISTLLMNCMNKKMYRAIIQNLQICKNDTVLDIGFGNGFLLNQTAKKNPQKLLGVEISNDMIFEASKRNKLYLQNEKMELSLADVQNLPYADNFIDKIYTVNTVYFWKDTMAGFAEIYRILKPNGLFLNAVYTKKWLNRLPVTKYGFHKFTLEELQIKTAQCGFLILKVLEIEKSKSLCIISKKVNI